MIVLRTDKELAAMNCKKQGRFLFPDSFMRLVRICQGLL
jgi:hypothetical protein